MSAHKECTSYRLGQFTCADGFIQTYPCWGDAHCSQCGQVKAIPHCMKDELPEHWIKDDGSPAFYSFVEGEK